MNVWARNQVGMNSGGRHERERFYAQRRVTAARPSSTFPTPEYISHRLPVLVPLHVAPPPGGAQRPGPDQA